MKIAIVGVGEIARNQHIPSIEASKDWELAATVSRAGKVDGVEAFTDIDDMLRARDDIGVVSLCLPPVPRFDYAAKALKAGRHVMLEKPPGATLAECAALEAMAMDAGRTLYATWHSRQASKVRLARHWLADKTLHALKIVWREDVRKWHPGQDWIWQPGGLGVFDPGINALSIMTEILPVPVHLKHARLEVPSNRQTPIAAQMEFVHPDGASVAAEFDWRRDGGETWSIFVDTGAGSLTLHDGGARLELDGVMDEADPETPGDGEYPRLYARMAELVASGEMETDVSPLRHVADAFMLGRREIVDPFVE